MIIPQRRDELGIAPEIQQIKIEVYFFFQQKYLLVEVILIEQEYIEHKLFPMLGENRKNEREEFSAILTNTSIMNFIVTEIFQ